MLASSINLLINISNLQWRGTNCVNNWFFTSANLCTLALDSSFFAWSSGWLSPIIITTWAIFLNIQFLDWLRGKPILPQLFCGCSVGWEAKNDHGTMVVMVACAPRNHLRTQELVDELLRWNPTVLLLCWNSKPNPHSIIRIQSPIASVGTTMLKPIACTPRNYTKDWIEKDRKSIELIVFVHWLWKERMTYMRWECEHRNNSARKTEVSPYRRNPLTEVDPNSLAYPQSNANNGGNKVQNKGKKKIEAETIQVNYLYAFSFSVGLSMC